MMAIWYFPFHLLFPPLWGHLINLANGLTSPESMNATLSVMGCILLMALWILGFGHVYCAS